MANVDSPRMIQDRKGIRKEVLINALNQTQNLQENVGFNTISCLDSVIATAEVINHELSLDEKVENQDEIVLDSEVMKSSSNVIRQCTNCLTKDVNSYNADEYTEFIMEYVRQSAVIPDEDEGISWNVMEGEITYLFKKTPFFSTLSGALEPLPKKPIEKKVRSPNQKEAPAKIKKPDKIISVEKEEETVEASVDKIRKLISRYHKENQKPLDYFQLVLHPTDFGRTVENVLHVAFLVRDGIISLSFGDSGALEIVPRSKEMIMQAKKSGKKGNVQNIISLNVQQWRIITNKYNIYKPMIDFRVGQQT